MIKFVFTESLERKGKKRKGKERKRKERKGKERKGKESDFYAILAIDLGWPPQYFDPRVWGNYLLR